MKEWNEISSSSLLNKIKIDTDFGIKQKYFGDLDIDEIVQEKIKVNNEKYPVSKAKGKSDKYNKL